jgi:hypothetical protein
MTATQTVGVPIPTQGVGKGIQDLSTAPHDPRNPEGRTEI